MEYYKSDIPIINVDEHKAEVTDMLYPKQAAFGHDPAQIVTEMHAAPSDMKIIPQADWDGWYDEQEAKQSSLEHLFLSGPGGAPAFVNLDQNGHGYCWAYSVGSAIMLNRVASHQPMVRLNPHAVAAIIKGGRDEGGWCGLSAKFAREHGYPSAEFWPGHSRSLSNDTPAMRQNAALHKVTEDWVDLTRNVYDQNLSVPQLVTALIQCHAGPVDFNWWAHSVCAVRWVRIERGSWGLLILNSWLGWGRHGLGVLRGQQAIPNGALTIRVTGASPV